MTRAGLDPVARDIQPLAYTCQIQPNSATNGVWLRGPWLYDGNQRWEDLRPDLLSADRDRPQHQPIHTTVYMRWVRDNLDSYATMNGTCLSDIGMLGELREMKGKIIAGKAKF